MIYILHCLSLKNIKLRLTKCFDSTSRYLVYLLNIDNVYFEQMIDQIYPFALKSNKAN